LIRQRFEALAPFLDERGRRLVAASEAVSAGYGGIAAVAGATGVGFGGRLFVFVWFSNNRRLAVIVRFVVVVVLLILVIVIIIIIVGISRWQHIAHEDQQVEDV
jgi:hypothetical protein